MAIVQLIIGLVSIFSVRYFYRKRNSSNRPPLTVFLDTLLDLPYFLKLGPFSKEPTIEYAVEKALKTTKLNDFGTRTTDFIHRYKVAREVGLAKSGAKFSPLGHIVVQSTMTQRVVNRLNLVNYLKNHSDILKINIKSPIFVIGFVRTGTTFLHEMLGLHENLRSHYTWEQLDCIPKTNDEDLGSLTQDRTKRYDVNKGQFEFLFKNLIGEKIQHIHRIAYDEPEECTIPCAFELPWGLTELPLMMFAAEEIFPLGAGEAFELYYKFLQLMTWQSPDRRDQDFSWILKCPFHLPYLEELFQAFPDATVVWTHRDPAECIASGCSLHETIMQMGMEESTIDKKKIGEAMMKFTHLSLAKAEETIKKYENKIKLINIRYKDNVKDSKNVIKSVLKEANIPFTPTYEEKLDQYLRESKEKREKIKQTNKREVVHDYKPEDYGLTKERIHEEFKEYINKYDLLEKKN